MFGKPKPDIPRFIAAYESLCANCFADIEPGDEAGYIGDDSEASCEKCCKEAEECSG